MLTRYPVHSWTPSTALIPGKGTDAHAPFPTFRELSMKALLFFSNNQPNVGVK